VTRGPDFVRPQGDGASRHSRGRCAPYDALVGREGLSASHRLLIDAVPERARTLDVGCSGGYLAVAMREERGASVLGVEPDPVAAEAARRRGVEVVVGSVEDPAVLAALRGPFDAIVCGDVLEHVVDPWGALAALARVLRPGGRAVVSLPNAAHWTVRRALLRGRFPREDHGLFDRTHLRWFTRADARALVTGAGLEIVGERFTEAPLPLEARVALPDRVRSLAVRRAPELFALQVVLVGQRPADAR
jgi:methionine biosynthesis protein MetW